MADDDAEQQTFSQKLLFYTTAFFILLGIFSLFAFLFLVPFVIDPAFTTISLEFETSPVLCQTMEVETFRGLSNCSWASCREGCTREMFECTQIRVRYKLIAGEEKTDELNDVQSDEAGLGSMKERRSIAAVTLYGTANATAAAAAAATTTEVTRYKRAIRDYDYLDKEPLSNRDAMYDTDLSAPEPTGLMGNRSEWHFVYAKIFPNVKGCGYPPMLNCTIWLGMYTPVGPNYTCYYSKIDPGIVITELDMDQVYLNLVLAVAIPIPSFIISVIYLTIAYFKIYNEEEPELLVNEEEVVEGDVGTPVPALTSGHITPGSETFREDLASFGHQLKVAMADEMSRESIVEAVPNNVNNSNHSISGNLSKTMTTSILTPPGPIATL